MASCAAVIEPELTQRQVRRMVDTYGYAWGRQWRRNFGVDALFPIKSLLGRIQEEAEGAGQPGTTAKHYPEVFVGDALVFACAWHKMRERDRRTAMIHYVVIELVKVKAAVLDIEVRTYHQRREVMQDAMARLLDL